MTEHLIEALRLADYILRVSKGKEFPGEFTDLDTARNYGYPMIKDLGDFLPFMMQLGEIDRKYSEFATEKAAFTLKRAQHRTGLFLTKLSLARQGRYGWQIWFDADAMSDVIVGIHLLYELTGEMPYLESSQRFFEGIEKHLMTRKGYVLYKSFLRPWLTIPFSTGKYSGLYIEESVRLYEFTGESDYLDLAWRMAFPWIKNGFFLKHGLFPFVCTLGTVAALAEAYFKKRTSFDFSTAMLTKANTNLIFGLTRLQAHLSEKTLGEAINRWADAVNSKLLTERNLLNSIWHPARGSFLPYLGADHAAIDALIEISLINRNTCALALAETIANGWLALQSESGLIPEIPFSLQVSDLSPRMLNRSMEEPGISRLDSQTDMAIILLKMHELTGEQRYREAGLRIIQGVLERHRHRGAFAEFYDMKTGKKAGYIIETKMLTLFLKPLLLLGIDGEVYSNPLLKDLIRDR